jgi:hypothetical protein
MFYFNKMHLLKTIAILAGMMEATVVILATTTAYSVQDEKPTKPDKYCYTVFYLDLQGNIDPSDSDTSCYPKKQQCDKIDLPLLTILK